MKSEKLLKAIAVELREAKTMRKEGHYRTMKACLLHIKHLIEKNVK